TVGTDEKVVASIDKVMNGPSAGEYYTAGRYYFESGKDIEKAYAWVKKSNEMDPDKFWKVRLQSLIEAKMGETAKAIETAKHSKALAEKAGNKDYIRLNEKSIMEWTKK
ncbi:MAG: dihydrolipoamide dehydrogenase, partial [Bacteroidota bacterium]